ncbi:alpha/beta fold hydrolase [Agromyces atrinae]|uniref:Alpha/beta fold hydrolase n=1 Tax=Agromyces atrinae TaxID=592376 RepID=A0A4Q2M208_9MICO|nr:alpha/beta fold hydrolase [Agromyces atrinae]NYD68566.1 pimeloyl-ACP methyl ester carboxylesterase [Agromyces atrinae]RXZ85944.1 alpha/beta fold hydrolase [Agromyces atrinae]
MTLYAEARDGALIAYEVHAGGNGSPVLLVHGFASNTVDTWERTGWIRAVVDSGRAAITVDLRGHGQSDKPAVADAYTIDRLGADLLAVIDSAGADQVDVVAYSLGCRVAASFARLAPDRIGRLVLGGAGPDELFARWDLAEVDGLLREGRASSDAMITAVLAPALAAGADPEALAALVAGVAGADLTEPRGIPVLFVAGENDPVPAGAEELAREWGAGFLSIPGRDHISTLTSRTFKDAALAFLGGADQHLAE